MGQFIPADLKPYSVSSYPRLTELAEVSSGMVFSMCGVVRGADLSKSCFCTSLGEGNMPTTPYMLNNMPKAATSADNLASSEAI